MPTTALNRDKYIGRTGTWLAPVGFKIPVRVKDVRRAYGRIELQVTPVNGTGEAWVQTGYVNLDPVKAVLA